MPRGLWIAIALPAILTAPMTGVQAQTSAELTQPGSTLTRTVTVNIPAQKLAAALIELSHQAEFQVLIPSELTEVSQSRAVSGRMSVQEALGRILEGTNLRFQEVGVNAIGIEKAAPRTTIRMDSPSPEKDATTRSQPVSWSQPSAGLPEADTDGTEQQIPHPSAIQAVEQLEQVVVTGSRIKRTSVEGPAPVTVITSRDIDNNGFSTIPEVMASLPQNLGALDNNQYTSGFTPGAQAVDLRGLGPNHTLVLVNGRRIADYPQAYGGNSNFTDISNIPTSLVDRIEILSGSASAVYGSDAISGVINFILKNKVEGTTVDLRVGDTQHGGGASQRVQITSGFSNDRFDSVFGLELYRADPIWAMQRDFTNSLLDGPGGAANNLPDPVFARYDGDGNYIDPGPATCAKLANLDRRSIVYATDPDYGNYCGSYRDYAYATLSNGDRSANLYASLTYHLNDNAHLFLDIQAGTSSQKLYNSPLKWQNSYVLDDNSTPTPFFNAATGQVEQWQRQYFTLEENGGLDPGEIHAVNHSLSLNTGIKGALPGGAWGYELTFGHAHNYLENREPALLAAKAQALYLGPSLGVDPQTGLNIYNAPPDRLYTPLTVDQFRSISQDSIDHDKAGGNTLTLQLTNEKLLTLPAGPVGFAAVAEAGTQYYDAAVDPLSLDGSYYGLHNTGATGSRRHQGAGVELRVPALTQLTLTAATRFDNYKYGDTSAGKMTYALGLEYRPFSTMLVRSSYSTGFRAPDLSYLYAGPSGSSSSGTDYYLCRLQNPGSSDFSDCTYNDISYDGRSNGSIALRDETSRSFTGGFIIAPFTGFDFSADFYYIWLKDEVRYQSSDTVLRQEADCRLGQTVDGQPVNIDSPTCQQVLSEVVRNAPDAFNPLQVTSVLVKPVNAAQDRTNGIDVAAHYHYDTGRFGAFSFSSGLTRVLSHTTRNFAGDPVDDEMRNLFVYVLPYWKANASVTWSLGPLSTTVYDRMIGGLPNYDGTRRLGYTSVYNGSVSYQFSQSAQLRLTVDNLLDTKPPVDSTWTSWPFYSRNWFSPVGRAFYLSFNYQHKPHH
ncbi:MAG: TonB-dependent receptor [Proteobacteria bacterium]|nr:TonB-dependent receptor [Pseudomonadota bacterium]